MKLQNTRQDLSIWSLCLLAASDHVSAQIQAPIDPLKFKAACPDYKNYAMRQQ
jgi:hypothetical protein